MIDTIDALPEIVNWRAAAGTIFLVSDKGVNWITNEIHKKYSELKFLVVPLKLSDVQGYQDKKTWDFIEIPKPASSTE
jgi:hypothetical protein